MLLLLEMMKMKNRIATRLTLLLLALGLASPVLASDGVLEINQTCAQAGCFNGDSPGWPVTIIRAGSYRLTSNLNLDENTDAITVGANDVGIDLNGFAIIGPVTCSGSGLEGPLTCSPASGTGTGVELTSSSIAGTSVKNGSISGMGWRGVYLGPQAEVTNLRVRWNLNLGIRVSNGSTVSGNTVYQNGALGIHAANGSTVSGNTVYQNGSHGIQAAVGLTVSGNTVYENGDAGITVSHSVVSGNTVHDNVGKGISATASVISGNSVTLNGSDGIWSGGVSLVSGNMSAVNGGWGLWLYNDATDSYRDVYRDNVITSNASGTVTGGVDAGGNVCDGNTTCP